MLDTTHTKNAQAVEDSELLVLMKDAFRRLLEMHEDLAAAAQKRLEQRQADTAAKVETERASR